MTTTVETGITGPLTANGVTPLPFTFQAISEDEVGVELDGVELVLDTDYTVALSDGGTGTVTPLVDFGSGVVYIYSLPVFGNPIDFARHGAFYPDRINPGFDRQARQIIRLKDLIDRTVRYSLGAGGLELTDETDGVLGVDADGLPVVFPRSSFQGDPGGNTMAIGLFTAASGMAIATGTDLVQTTGYDETGLGVATYMNDAAVDAAYVAANPYTSFTSVNGRGFRLVPNQVVNVHALGAKGDGTTDDTLALRRASDLITEWDGGTIAFERRDYLIGTQTLAGATGLDYAWRGPGDALGALMFEGVAGNITIEGNGAKFVFPDDYKFGSYDPVTGAAAGLSVDLDNWAYALHAPIYLKDNTGHISVDGFEVDGGARVGEIALGGAWGDTGYQVAGSALWAYGNASLSIRNFYGHHMPLDGMIYGQTGLTVDDPSTPLYMENVRLEYNGRNGLSYVGGRGAVIVNCQFNYQGKGGLIASSPMSGLDIEAESAVCRQGNLQSCEFVGNGRMGVLADSGDSADFSFHDCRFIGTEHYAAKPNRPYFRFYGCRFVGTTLNPYPATDSTPDEATFFEDCLFTNDVAYAPGGIVYTPGRAIFDYGGVGGPVRFNRCTVRHNNAGALAFNVNGAVWLYNDCTVIAKAGSLTIEGRWSGLSRFINDGGTVAASPGASAAAQGGTADAGAAVDPWTYRNAGTTVTYAPLVTSVATYDPNTGTVAAFSIEQNGARLNFGGAATGSYIQSLNALPLIINHAGNETQVGQGNFNLTDGGVMKVAGTKVIGAQGAAVADPAAITSSAASASVAAPTKAEFDAFVGKFNQLLTDFTSVRTAQVALLARVRAATGHGLIA